jgi:transposase
MFYLGIDQHKSQLTVNLRGEDGNVILKRQVSTQWEKVRAFFADLAEKAGPDGGFLAILEVCGMNPWLLAMLQEYGCRETVVIQPTDRSKQKTDRRDAGKLGHLLWVHRQEFLEGKHPLGLRRVQPPTPQEADDRQLTMLRARLTKKRTAVLNGLHKILRKHNLEQGCPTKKFQTQKVRRWLTEMELPTLDRLELNLLLPQWDLLDEQLKAVEERIAERAACDERAQLLESVPGFGHYSALAIASRIGDIERFRRPDSLANYFGLTPGCRDSGEATQRLGSITKQGSKLVRYLLGQAVVRLLRCDEKMRAWFKRIKKRRGAKIARVAVMRRLTTILWHMLKKKEKYRYEPTLPKHQEFVAFEGQVDSADMPAEQPAGEADKNRALRDDSNKVPSRGSKRGATAGPTRVPRKARTKGSVSRGASPEPPKDLTPEAQRGRAARRKEQG